MSARLTRRDLAELEEWAADVVEQANSWAERAEVASRASLVTPCDALAACARRVEGIANVLQ